MNKKLLLVPLAVLCMLLVISCNQQKVIKNEMDEKYTVCYTAIFKTDTAWLKIDTANKHILGELKFNYHNEKHYDGLVKAEMKGDTLRGYYSFKLNKVDKWYKNPIALLKKENTLTMGIGEVYTLWGSGYFHNQYPIDYAKSRFVFEQVGCEIQM